MIPQQKLKRQLELIEYLHPPGKTKAQLAKYLSCSPRSIERYFVLLEEVGFQIEKDEAKRFFIFQALNRGIPVSFSQQEAEFLSDLVSQVVSSHPLSSVIQTKLFFRSQGAKLTKSNFRKFIPKVIQNLSDAMKLNRQVVIKRYFSASTGQVHSPRIVSPLSFTDNYRYLIAYEEKADKFINMALDRIAEVEVLEDKCTKTPDDIIGIDDFQIVGNSEPYEVKLLLSPLAYRLLLEEHPATEAFIEAVSDEVYSHRFVTSVYNFLPIGRFCLGLPLDVRVESPPELRSYLLEKVKKNTW